MEGGSDKGQKSRWVEMDRGVHVEIRHKAERGREREHLLD